jgi:2-polyprenyl-3-methyl-5-hydroxy-6-metoxy-1,4-benzoquinol methylase
MSGCCSPFSEIAGRQFDAEKVASEVADYRKSGPGPTTRLLRDGLVQAGLVRGVLLDIGAGLGALTFELIDRGSTQAIAVDASSSYLDAAAQEASRRHQRASIEFVHGDFVDVAATIPKVDVVTLDRVVCCYPHVEPLLSGAIEHATRALALSYPRESWFARAVMGADNLKRKLKGNPFRTFVHSPTLMEAMIRHAGFTLAIRRRTWIWSIDVFVRL